MNPLYERVLIAGVGLIGGSLGLAIRRRRLAREVIGYGRGVENLETALEKGAIDRYSLSPEEAARGADLVVLGMPVAAMARGLAPMLPHMAEAATVIDVGSVKGAVVAALEPLLSPPRAFVPCHPIAGTERSGAAAAFETLFDGERCIVTPTSRTDSAAAARVERLWQAVGMRVERMSPESHDRLLGLVSHLPHVVAYALVGAIEGERVDGRDPLEYAGGGLRDTTRIASSHPEMWRDIFLENREETLATIRRFEAELSKLRSQIESRDGAALETELGRIRAARERLRKS